jgi:hypothetical protein
MGDPDMTRILVDPALREKLRDLKEPLELCDESGRVLAVVIPDGLDRACLDEACLPDQIVPRPDLSEYEPCEPHVSDEELLRRARTSGRRYTTAEVLAYLETL